MSEEMRQKLEAWGKNDVEKDAKAKAKEDARKERDRKISELVSYLVKVREKAAIKNPTEDVRDYVILGYKHVIDEAYKLDWRGKVVPRSKTDMGIVFELAEYMTRDDIKGKKHYYLMAAIEVIDKLRSKEDILNKKAIRLIDDESLKYRDRLRKETVVIEDRESYEKLKRNHDKFKAGFAAAVKAGKIERDGSLVKPIVDDSEPVVENHYGSAAVAAGVVGAVVGGVALGVAKFIKFMRS